MYSIKINIIYFILVNIIVQIQSLVQLPVVEDYNIAITETVIRNTVNTLFTTLNIQGIKKRSTLKQYSTIHDFFVFITLTDCENLKKIARLSTVNNIDNSTQRFITQINEVLNEADKNNEANNNDNNIHVATYIERFIKKLRYLKGIYVSKNDTTINKEVLKFLENGKSFTNVTADINSNKTIEEPEDNNLLGEIEVWKASGRRIFEGTRTNIFRFPFMASIHFFKTFQCAGSIIKDDLIITSSSCMQIAWNNRFFRENPSFLSVKVGSDMYQTGGDDVPVLEIYFHPQYEPSALAHNLAILRLGRVLKFRRKRKSIKKINVDTNPVPLSLNTRITIVGWGAKDRSNVVYDVYRNKLSYAYLDFYPLKECQEHYSNVYVTNRNFCAGFFSKGSGACNHDAGGPGIVDSTLTGVISFGSSACGAEDAPTVFTKLGYYTDWIESIMEQDVFSAYQHTTTRAPTTTQQYYTHPTKETTKLVIEPIDFSDMHGENMLRMAKDKRFKDFISTMFSSEEVRVYLDNESESKEKNIGQSLRLNKIERGTATMLNDEELLRVTKANPSVYRPSTRFVESVDSPREFSNAKTLNEKVPIKNQSGPSVEPANVNRSIEVQPIKVNTSKSLEDDIMTLINNLDIDNLLSSVEKKNGIEQNNNNSLNQVSASKGNELKSVELRGNQDDENQSDLRFFLQSEEDEDGGMSIPSESFHGLTFRETTDTADKNIVLSESALLDLISFAIKKEGNTKMKENPYIL